MAGQQSFLTQGSSASSISCSASAWAAFPRRYGSGISDSSSAREERSCHEPSGPSPAPPPDDVFPSPGRVRPSAGARRKLAGAMCTDIQATRVHHRAGGFFRGMIDQRADSRRARFNPLAGLFRCAAAEKLCRRAATDIAGTHGEDSGEHVPIHLQGGGALSSNSEPALNRALTTLQRVDQGACRAATIRHPL
jgi:hypothetical protein